MNHRSRYFNKISIRILMCLCYNFDIIVAQWGVKKIHIMAVIASKKGLEQLTAAHPDIRITVGEIDDNGEDGQLLPGLGDSGDRLFGTAQLAEDDEALLHPSRRKRTMSEAE